MPGFRIYGARRGICTLIAPVLSAAQGKDFVYFDPPYVPAKAGSKIDYTAQGFDLNEQARLANVCGKLTRKGVRWMVSNADVAFIRKLYGHYRIEEIEAPRSISAVAKGRGNARELLVMNYG